MAKLVNLIPGREINSKPTMKEELEDMDVSLPSQLERYLDRTADIIKRYNLSKSKEQYIMAKLIDALNMNPSDLSTAVSKLKRFKVVHK